MEIIPNVRKFRLKLTINFNFDVSFLNQHRNEHTVRTNRLFSVSRIIKVGID